MGVCECVHVCVCVCACVCMCERVYTSVNLKVNLIPLILC